MFCLIMCKYYEHDTVLVHNKNLVRKSVVIKTVDTLVLKSAHVCLCVSVGSLPFWVLGNIQSNTIL